MPRKNGLIRSHLGSHTAGCSHVTQTLISSHRIFVDHLCQIRHSGALKKKTLQYPQNQYRPSPPPPDRIHFREVQNHQMLCIDSHILIVSICEGNITLSITHQKSLKEESPYRSSELTKLFPRLRRRNASSLTFEKL